MQTRTLFLFGIVWLAGTTGLALSQPLSAIDWLTDSVSIPPVIDRPKTDTADPSLPDPISVRPIGAPSMDGIGLVDASAFGLPSDMWEASDPETLARLIARTLPQIDAPATRVLLTGLLTVAARPPAAMQSEGEFFLARVDKLLELGGLEPAAALLELADLSDPRIFKRWFDVRLLLGTEDAACARLSATPDLSPTFPTTIFCLARAGNWDAAALTLDTAKALGLITPAEDALLLRFLDGTNAEEHGPLTLPTQITPLMFRLYEAVGEPIPTKVLPRAFALSDLTAQSGWKARLSAAERLTAAGALPAQRLFDIYREQAPAASGGVWERARAVQQFDAVLAQGDDEELASQLLNVWSALTPLHLGPAFAEEYGRDLLAMARKGVAQNLAFRIALLRPGGAKMVRNLPDDPELQFLVALGKGRVPLPTVQDPIATQVRDAFEADELPSSLELLVNEGRYGEAALIGLNLLSTGADGDGEDLIIALRLLRRLGLETTAQQAALALLIQERRG